MPAPNDPWAQEYWQYYPTPNPEPTVIPQGRRRGKKRNQSRQPVDIHNGQRHLAAVALDCEMGTATSGETELIRLTAVDFFTGQVLIDNLVQPAVPMAHYNTRFSGVTARDMREAVTRRTCIFGRDRARQALWQYVGPETIVVVHGGQNDLSSLRWIHPRIIDTFLLEGYVGSKTAGGRSLQNLCRMKLGIAVQEKRPGKGPGHDSLEDAMACRELVVDWASKIPDI